MPRGVHLKILISWQARVSEMKCRFRGAGGLGGGAAPPSSTPDSKVRKQTDGKAKTKRERRTAAKAEKQQKQRAERQKHKKQKSSRSRKAAKAEKQQKHQKQKSKSRKATKAKKQQKQQKQQKQKSCRSRNAAKTESEKYILKNNPEKKHPSIYHISCSDSPKKKSYAIRNVLGLTRPTNVSAGTCHTPSDLLGMLQVNI